ncbi:MAG TPA: STAS domain-containing protein [Sporichthyaceae bacterium]|nr:STAS domain-containing protein [Sporichthyaceae bacterium]
MDAEISVRRAGNVAVAVLQGEYDLSNAAAMYAELIDVLRCRPTGIVLDVAAVEFCDLACLRSMANLGRRAAAVGIWVRMAGPSPMMRRLLEITGLGASLPAYRDVELALRGTRRATVPGGRDAKKVHAAASRSEV